MDIRFINEITLQKKIVLSDYKDNVLFSVIAGSNLYNIANEQSDIDIRGVFILPECDYNQMDSRNILFTPYVEQLVSERNDIVYFELAKYLRLLSNSNPNITELLFAPEHLMYLENPLVYELFTMREDFLTKTLVSKILAQAKTFHKSLDSKPVEKHLKQLVIIYRMIAQANSILKHRVYVLDASKDSVINGLITGEFPIEKAKSVFKQTIITLEYMIENSGLPYVIDAQVIDKIEKSIRNEYYQAHN